MVQRNTRETFTRSNEPPHAQGNTSSLVSSLRHLVVTHARPGRRPVLYREERRKKNSYRKKKKNVSMSMSTQSTCWTASKNLTELCSCFQIQRKKGRRMTNKSHLEHKKNEREREKKKKKNHHRWGASRWRNNVGEGNQNCRGWISAAPSRRTQNEGESNC